MNVNLNPQYSIAQNQSQTEVVTLTGDPGARGVGSAGDAALDVSWIAYAGRVYQVTGIAPLEDYERFQTAFIDVAQISSWFEGSDERTERDRQLTVAHG